MKWFVYKWTQGSGPTPPSVLLSSPQAGNHEVGDTINVVLNASYTKHTNNIAGITYHQDGASIQTWSIGPWSGTDSYTQSGVTSNIPTTFNFDAKATDVNSLSGTSNVVQVNFEPMTYRGSNAVDSLLEADILALANSRLSSNRIGNYLFSMALGTYKYICYPTVLGLIPDPTSDIIDMGTGFPVPFQLQVGTISVTNSFGVTLDYNVYRSINILGWAQNLRITI